MRKYLLKTLCFVCLSLAFMFSGCTTKVTNSSYPSAFVWNDIIYSLTPDVVKADELGDELGQLQKKVETLPKQNGETNDGEVGSKIFEIKKVNTAEAVAVEFKGNIRKATKWVNTTMVINMQEGRRLWRFWKF